MELSKITLTNGTTYLVKHTPEDIYQMISHSDGEPKNHVHLFTLENGHEMYINAMYILSIEKVHSHISDKIYSAQNETDTDSDKEEKNTERIKDNLEAAKEFKEDLNGNME